MRQCSHLNQYGPKLTMTRKWQHQNHKITVVVGKHYIDNNNNEEIIVEQLAGWPSDEATQKVGYSLIKGSGKVHWLSKADFIKNFIPLL